MKSRSNIEIIYRLSLKAYAELFHKADNYSIKYLEQYAGKVDAYAYVLDISDEQLESDKQKAIILYEETWHAAVV